MPILGPLMGIEPITSGDSGALPLRYRCHYTRVLTV